MFILNVTRNFCNNKVSIVNTLKLHPWLLQRLYLSPPLGCFWSFSSSFWSSLLSPPLCAFFCLLCRNLRLHFPHILPCPPLPPVPGSSSGLHWQWQNNQSQREDREKLLLSDSSRATKQNDTQTCVYMYVWVLRLYYSSNTCIKHNNLPKTLYSYTSRTAKLEVS